MTDRIELHGLSAFGRHGVLDFEKEIPQPFVLDISLEVDVRSAAAADDLTQSLSYAEVAARALEVCASESVNLIETLAERVAQACLGWPMVECAQVRVRKPHAPAGVPWWPGAGEMPGPSVVVRRERSREVVIALGTNLGRRVATLASAIECLRALDGLQVIHVSPIVETDPVGGVEQDDYLNAVVVGVTRLSPEHLLRELHSIEARHGRRRDVRWGARTLDLDLIQMGIPGEPDEVLVGGCDAAAALARESPLALPHPRAADRAFVVAPWASATPWACLRRGVNVVPLVQVLSEMDLSGVRTGPAWSNVEGFDLTTPARLAEGVVDETRS